MGDSVTPKPIFLPRGTPAILRNRFKWQDEMDERALGMRGMGMFATCPFESCRLMIALL